MAGPGERGGGRRWSGWTGWVDSPRADGGRVDGQVGCLLNCHRFYPCGQGWPHPPGRPHPPPGPRPWAARRGKGSWLFLPGCFLASPSPFPITALRQPQLLSLQTIPPAQGRWGSQPGAPRGPALRPPASAGTSWDPRNKPWRKRLPPCSHLTGGEAEARWEEGCSGTGTSSLTPKRAIGTQLFFLMFNIFSLILERGSGRGRER